MSAWVDESHPDYPEYLGKCKALWARYKKIIDEEEAKYPNWYPGLTYADPAEPEVRKIMRRHDMELMALQTEYDYLFREVPDKNETAIL